MSFTSALAVVTVTDFDAALDWYSTPFARDPDQEPMPGLAQWELGPGSTVQVVHDADRGGARPADPRV